MCQDTVSNRRIIAQSRLRDQLEPAGPKIANRSLSADGRCKHECSWLAVAIAVSIASIWISLQAWPQIELTMSLSCIGMCDAFTDWPGHAPDI